MSTLLSTVQTKRVRFSVASFASVFILDQAAAHRSHTSNFCTLRLCNSKSGEYKLKKCQINDTLRPSKDLNTGILICGGIT